ncbi:MAG: TIGR03067 domain-containing protein [Nitrospira sp.]|nr:TIGR03067 domain-containing protein [Nitrospira sp.]
MSAVLFLSLATAVAAPAKDPAKKEPPSLLGEWTVMKVTVGGKDSANLPSGAALRFLADGVLIILEGDGEEPQMGTYSIDVKADPCRIDIKAANRQGDGIFGIFKIEGDTLTICMSQNAAERPQKFESPPGSQVALITLAKAKK